MKSFKEYLRRLEEDKVIAKEDEGAAAPAGDVSAPSGGSAPSGEVVTSQPKTDGGITTVDVLGKCDHKHDGFFGPGCLHRPFPIFSYPVSRIKRKKKKYIKVLDLTESEEYGEFRPLARSIIDQEMEDANRYLQKTGIRCFYEDDYRFSGKKKDWVGATDFENQQDANEFGIAINLPVLYEFLEENGLEDDETEIGCQIKATIYHEIGHCLIQKFRDDEIYDFEMTENEEEKLVEQFANYMMREYTGTTSSKLNDFITEIFGENISEDQLNETDQIIRGKFFTNPIKIDHPQRYVKTKQFRSGEVGTILPEFEDVLVKAEEKVFSGAKIDYFASLTDAGYLVLTPALSGVEQEFGDIIQQYNSLPAEMRDLCLSVTSDPENPIYDDESEGKKLPQEIEEIRMLASYMTPEQREVAAFLEKLQRTDGRLYIRATVADIIRTFHGKRDTLPLAVLIDVDTREHEMDYRYDEAETEKATCTEMVSESGLDIREWLCRKVMQREKETKKYSAEKTPRWGFMKQQLGNELQKYEELGDLVYKIYSKVQGEPSMSYVYSKMATLIGINKDTYQNQTFYYMGPSDLIKNLKFSKDGTDDTRIDEGKDKVDNVPLDFLWTALMNVVTGRAFAGSERGTAKGRASERKRT